MGGVEAMGEGVIASASEPGGDRRGGSEGGKALS